MTLNFCHQFRTITDNDVIFICSNLKYMFIFYSLAKLSWELSKLTKIVVFSWLARKWCQLLVILLTYVWIILNGTACRYCIWSIKKSLFSAFKYMIFIEVMLGTFRIFIIVFFNIIDAPNVDINFFFCFRIFRILSDKYSKLFPGMGNVVNVCC